MALALDHEGDTLWGLLPVVLACSVLFQAGTNVINDYFDYARGVDQNDPHSGSSGVLTKVLIMREREVFLYGIGLFEAGVLLGLALVYFRAACRCSSSAPPASSAATSTPAAPKATSTSRSGTLSSSSSWAHSRL